jgi:hypothetical protein
VEIKARKLGRRKGYGLSRIIAHDEAAGLFFRGFGSASRAGFFLSQERAKQQQSHRDAHTAFH